MKIALVAHHARRTGGQDRYVLELARQLATRHEVHLVVVRAEGCEGSPVKVHPLGLPDRPVLWLAPRFARRARALVRREGFDVVHAVGGSLPGANVITAQYCQAAWLAAKRRYHVREGSTASESYQWLVTRQGIAHERRAYADRSLREVIAVGHATGQELVRHYALSPSRLTVVHNGVDPALFRRERYPGAGARLRTSLGLPRESSVALLVGTYARKGLETAIAAAARASERLHVVVAGTGDEALARRWAAAAGLGGRLHLLGARSDAPELFAAADLFILPTRYEPFGMVIVEAMATELPVVVSACAGAAELIRHGENGFIVEAPDDAAAFAAVLRQLLADPERRRAVGAAARRAALTVAWPEIARRTEAVYQRVAPGGS